MKLKVLTCNIHKGVSLWGQKSTLERLRRAIRKADADLVFLQEVRGDKAIEDRPQYEYLADQIWSEFSYGKNAAYETGHHGNATLSKLLIKESKNIDVSAGKAERRGVLFSRLFHPDWNQTIYAANVHFGLLQSYRDYQFGQVRKLIDSIPPEAPFILAGDFNDWNLRAKEQLPLEEVFEVSQGKFARSFPRRLPLLRLDRVYARGFKVEETRILKKGLWKNLSDHAALFCELRIKNGG